MANAVRLIGYARVSTGEQSLNLQLDALKAAGCERVFKEKASATRSTLPVLATCLETLEAGDVLVVWRLDRFGRSLKDLVLKTHALGERGIGFQSIREKLDTTSPQGRFFFHVVAAMAEFEADLISERTKAGLKAARDRGAIIGRPRAVTPERMELALQLLAEKDEAGADRRNVSEVAAILGVSPSSLYRALRKSPAVVHEAGA